MDSSNYQPICVTVWLRTPVVSDDWLPLDGALLACRTREDKGAQALTIPGASTSAQPKGDPMQGGRLPIKIVHGKEWYYRCSWAVWGPHVDGKDHWHKRFDTHLADMVNFQGRRGRVIIEQDSYKAYRMPVYYRSALWVHWYMVADLDKIGHLLIAITHLGKKTSQGWGRVLRWQVEPCEADWSIWQDNRLMRGVPLRDYPKDRQPDKVGLYGVRPSYWDKRNQVELALP